MSYSPPAASFILDCSVTMAWCFEDEVTAYSEHIFDALLDSSALVPSIWPLEVANVLLIAERKKRIDLIKSAAFKDSLNSLSIHIDNSASNRAMNSITELARKTKLTIYDAAYLELALHTGLPLSSLDKMMIKAANGLNINLYEPQ